MSEETRTEGAEQRVNDDAPRSVSERKRQANRENSKKSTGPKTTRGKRNSSFNAVKHGLLVQRIIIETDDTAERLNQFAAGLYDRYGVDGDVRNELLLELSLVDYWRHARSLEAEGFLFYPTFGSSGVQPELSANLFRYMTSNRRTLIKTLDMLEAARDKRIHEEQIADLAADGPDARGARRGDPNKKPPRSHSSGDREKPPTPQASIAAQMAQGKKQA
jgi:hypothetical protein